MRIAISLSALLALVLGAAQAEAKSCSSFAVIKAYDPEASTVEVDHTRGKPRKFFPKPEGTPADSSKIPGKCRRKVVSKDAYAVKATGGRLTMTQVRSNFEGRMLNDTDDEQWLGKKLQELIENETKVVLVIRPGMGRDDSMSVTTIYLPITDEELAEIERIEKQAEDA